MNIGKAIKVIRKELGVSQTDLSDQCGISQTSLSQIESGIKHPSPKTIKSICDALGVPEPLIYIIGIDDQDVPQDRKEIYEKLFPRIKKLTLDVLGHSGTESK